MSGDGDLVPVFSRTRVDPTLAVECNIVICRGKVIDLEDHGRRCGISEVRNTMHISLETATCGRFDDAALGGVPSHLP